MRVQYDSYKESGIPWAGDIPSEWETYPFFALAKANGTKNSGLKEQNLLSLSYGRIIEKDINTKFGLLPESFESYQIVEPGQIVFRLTDLQNDKVSLRSALVKDRGIITSAYLAVEFKKLVPAYADYLMRAYDKQMVFYELGGGVRQSAKYDDLKWMPVIVPPEDEQKAIANLLDEKTAQIDLLIEKKEKLLELLAEKRTSLITQAVTKGLDPTAPMKPSGIEWLGNVPSSWKVFPLAYLCEVITGYAFSSDDFQDSGIPLIRISDVLSDGTVSVKNSKNLPNNFLTIFHRYTVMKNDILMAMTGGTIGKAGSYQYKKLALLNQRVCLLRKKRDFSQDFIRHLLDAHFYQEHIKLTGFGGAQPNISDTQIIECRVPIPETQVQYQISKYLNDQVEHIRKTKLTISIAISKLKEYRSVLITNAVTGKVKVN